MARYVTVCAFDTPPPDSLAAALDLADRLRLVRGEDHPDLWISWASFHEIEPSLAAALAAGQVRCTALLPTLPPPEQRWMLTEWRGQLAVHGSIADQLDPRFWDSLSGYDLIDMRTFTPARDTPGSAVTVSAAGLHRSRAEWVETAAEYRASLDTNRPTVITAPVRQIITRMRDWFGDLADERVGGAVAILAMSGVTPSARSQAVLRNPAALGLRRVSGHTALAAHARAGQLTAQAWGTRSDDPTRGLARPRPDYLRQESRTLTAGLRAMKATTRARYAVLVSLTAREDLEVLIGTGLVFEQTALNRVQNLAIAAGSIMQAKVGQHAALALPAWCLNRRLAPPGGEAVRATPLCLPLTADVNQAMVWSIVERSPENFGARA